MMKRMSMSAVSMCVVVAGLCLPRLVAAQIPDQSYQSNCKVKGFPIVYVTDALGSETKGKLLSWIGSEIVLETGDGSRTYKPGEAVRMDLRGDSLKNGALIGLGVGLAMGGLGAAACIDCGATRATILVTLAGFYTLVGVGIDALVPGRTPLWNAGPRANRANQRSARNGLTFRLSPERRSAFVGWRVR
jgi:hypothetical protein